MTNGTHPRAENRCDFLKEDATGQWRVAFHTVPSFVYGTVTDCDDKMAPR